jgi:oligopeptide transport system substrate-binding protein
MRRALLTFAAALFAAGCARHERVVDTGVRDGVLYFGNKDEPDDLDPVVANSYSGGNILLALYHGLVILSGDGQTVLPAMADRWSVSADGLTYTFHIRDNAQWSNGEPITSRDFLDSFIRVLDPRIGCENAGYFFPVRGAKAFAEGRSADPASVGMRAPDPRTLVLTLAHPASYLLTQLTQFPFFPVYMPALDASGGRHQRGGAWTKAGALVSNGPFVLSEWRMNAYVSVRRNPKFWDAAHVRLNEIRFYPTDDENAEERSFRAGQLHITARLPKTKVESYAVDHTGELHLAPILRTTFLTFNVARAPFTDARVRAAFGLAVDRERLVGAALGRLGTPAYARIRPGAGGFTPGRLFRFDPAEARRLLAAAGYPGGAGLPPIEFTLNGNAGVTLAVAEVLEEMWVRNLGVHVSVAPLEFKVYLDALRNKQYLLMLDSWLALEDPHDLLSQGSTNDPNNDSGCSNPAYDAAYADSENTADPAKRRAAFARMEEINAAEVYYAPLYYNNQGLLVDPRVRGWRDTPEERIDWRDLSLAP